MKIGIASLYFDSQVNYQETVLARSFARQGYEVVVYATQSGYREVEEDLPYRIIRSKRVIKVKNTILYSSKYLETHAVESEFDYFFAVTPDRGFSCRFIKALYGKTRIAAFFGDLWVNTKYPNWKKLFKYRIYQSAFKCSGLIICVTEETEEILKGFWNMPKSSHAVVRGLPHDEKVFRRYSNTYKNSLKQRINQDNLLLTITNFQSNKPIFDLLDSVNVFLKKNLDWHYIIAGAKEDNFSNSIREYCFSLESSDRIQILPALKEKEIVELNNRAKLSVWMQASIGVQLALACGLPVVLPKEKYFRHILEEDKNGVFYTNYNSLNLVLDKAASLDWNHEAIAEYSLQWSGDVSASWLIRELEETSIESL